MLLEIHFLGYIAYAQQRPGDTQVVAALILAVIGARETVFDESQ